MGMLGPKNRTIDGLRTMLDEVEQKAHVPADDPDVIALKAIVDEKIAKLEDDGSAKPQNDD